MFGCRPFANTFPRSQLALYHIFLLNHNQWHIQCVSSPLLLRITKCFLSPGHDFWLLGVLYILWENRVAISCLFSPTSVGLSQEMDGYIFLDHLWGGFLFKAKSEVSVWPHLIHCNEAYWEIRYFQ